MNQPPRDPIDWERLTSDARRRAAAPAFTLPVGPLEPLVYPDDPVQAAAAADGEPPEQAAPRSWLPRGLGEWFAMGLTLLPALLFLPGSQAYRLPARVGAYGISLYAFALWWFHRGARQKVRHPAARWLTFVVAWLVLEIAHPLTNSLLAGIAQVALYFAILAPVYWAPAYAHGLRGLKRILVVLLVCNGINSTVGVLQVYNPDRWMPQELSANFEENRDALAASTYLGPGGRPIVRPPGLFDTPGAVCSAGTIAALFGLVFALEGAWWRRAGALGFALAGIAAIYLSHVRASMIVVVGMMASYAAMLALQNQKKRLAVFGGIAVAVVLTGLTVSTILGGTSIRDRFSTLIEEDPTALYYESRGIQLEYAFNSLIVDYPFGAGLARWGMMRSYFGNPSNLDSSEVFAEIQPNAWLLDGGVLLLLFYGIGLAVTVLYDLRLVRSLADRDDRLWASSVVAANFGTLALVFSFVPFGTAAGMQFWFLEGVLHGAMAGRPRRA